VKAYRILSYSSDGECAANLQEMLEMSIGILQGLAAEQVSLHHIDESWFEFETSPGVFSRYHIYIFPREEVPLSCLRLTQGITQASSTRLYRSYVKKT
jgi:hypothetical protein